jgi:hypothetical protein
MRISYRKLQHGTQNVKTHNTTTDWMFGFVDENELFFNTITSYFLRILFQSTVSIFIAESKMRCDA